MDMNHTSIGDLPVPVLVQVLSYLDPKSLLKACQVCKAWHSAGSDKQLWLKIAAAVWPEACLDASRYDGSYKALYCDGNRRSAVASLPLLGHASKYRFRTQHAHYECKLLSMEVSFGEAPQPAAIQDLTLYLDARGELDLRRMDSSSLAVVRLKTAPEQLPATVDSLALSLRPDADPDSLPHILHVHAVASPNGLWPLSYLPHRQMGSLSWRGGPLTPLLQALRAHDDAHLVFIYANNLRAGPLSYSFATAMPDYDYVVLLKGGPELDARWRTPNPALQYMRSGVGEGSMPHRMAHEPAADARARWADLPPAIAARGDNWWAPAAPEELDEDGLGGHGLGIMEWHDDADYEDEGDMSD